jgi:ubiquinone biosynthesis protein UbiJ
MRNDKATFGWPFSLAANRLLDAEPEARARLAPFAGQVIELRAPPLPALGFTVLPGGRLEAGGSEPALVVRLKPELLAALGKSEDHLLRAVEVSGDAKLAAEAMWILRRLRESLPDIAEEDLSRVVGDVAAHRMAQGARDFLAWQADAAGRLAAAFADYATEEARLLVGRA